MADSESIPHPSRAARAVGSLAKAAVSLALLAIVLWRVPVGDAIQGVLSLSAPALVASVLLTFAFPALAALRWKRALQRLGSHVPWLRLMADTLVASTYNMLLPTSIGGDVVRAMRCARRTDRPSHAWSSAVFERLVGLVALVLLAVPGVVMAPGARGQISIALALVAVVSGLLVFTAHAPLRWAARVLARRAPVVARIGGDLADDLSGPLASLGARVEMLAWSTAYQAVGLGLLGVVVVDWGRPALWWAVLGAVPLALVLAMLPVSIAGLGVRESLFVLLLGRFGVAPPQALALAVVWLASALLLALAGGAVMMVEAASAAHHDEHPATTPPHREKC